MIGSFEDAFENLTDYERPLRWVGGGNTAPSDPLADGCPVDYEVRS